MRNSLFTLHALDPQAIFFPIRLWTSSFDTQLHTYMKHLCLRFWTGGKDYNDEFLGAGV